MICDGLVPSINLFKEKVVAGRVPHFIEIGEALLDDCLIVDNHTEFTVPTKGGFGEIARSDDRPTLAKEVQFGVKVSHAADPGAAFK